MKVQVILIEARGGLGNQLFLLPVADKISRTVNSHVYFVEMDKHHKSSSVRLDMDFISEMKLSFGSQILKYLIKLFRRYPAFFSKLRICVVIDEQEAASLFLDGLPWRQGTLFTVVSGYFANFNYLHQSNLLQNGFRVLKPTQDYLECEQTLFNEPFIAVHLRFGDFMRDPVAHGVLDYEYYRNAVQEIDIRMPGDFPIYLFSDQPELISEFLLNDNRVHVVETGNMKAIEVLNLISLADALILSLSTLGFWAGILSKKAKFVVYPSVNPKGKPFIENVPSAWIALQPIWLRKSRFG